MDPTTYNVHCANRMTVITKCHEGLVQRKFKLKVLVYDAELSDKIKDIEEIDLVCSNEKGTEKADVVFPDTEDSSTVIFTGGTSGKNKGAVLSNRAVMAEFNPTIQACSQRPTY